MAVGSILEQPDALALHHLLQLCHPRRDEPPDMDDEHPHRIHREAPL